MVMVADGGDPTGGATFEKAWEFTRSAEGLDKVYLDPKAGATKWGISQKLLNKLGKSIRAEDLTEETAAAIARTTFWDLYPYEKIASQAVATRVFDLSFLHGPSGSHKALQRAVNCATRAHDLLNDDYDPEQLLDEDGVFGRVTLQAVNVHCQEYSTETVLLAALIAAQLGRLEDIDDERHERGWVNRVLGRT